MNLEEARNNIGAEVELDESTKPYTDSDGVYESRGYVEQELSRGEFRLSGFNSNDVVISKELGSETVDFLVNPRHLKFKPQNYKIHVPTEAESKEAQELFFELGYEWMNSEKYVQHTDIPYLYSYNDEMKIAMGWKEELFNPHKNKQITLQDLRDMVAKKKQTQTIQEDIKPIVDGLETSVAIQDFDSNSDIEAVRNVKSHGAFRNLYKEMTWEDALRAVANDIKVEFYNELCEQWWDISHLSATEVVRIEKFRIAPKRIYLNGNFTKEELLQKAGEME